MELGQSGNPLFAENIYSLEDPNCKYLYGTELACHGNIFRPLAFPLTAGSLYLFQTHNAALKLIVWN
jgi:hypothetical protein